MLSITHKLSTDGGSRFDICKTRQSSPHNEVARWRISLPGEVTAQSGNFGQMILECLFVPAGKAIFH